MKTYIHHHLGMGDMIMCNGLVRYISENIKKNEKIYIFSKNNYLKLVKFMYRDNKKIIVIGIDEKKCEYKQVQNILRSNKNKQVNFIRIGHEFFNYTANLNLDKNNPWPCDIIFYKQLNIPFKYRFEKCFWKRDIISEKKLLEKFITKKEPYAFIHDDPEKGYFINTSYVNPKLKIIKNDKKYSIFDYGLIIENATEVHLMESVFRHVTESLNTKNVKLFLHDFRKGASAVNLLTNRNEWIGTSKVWNIIKYNKEKKSLYKKLKEKIIK